MRARRTRWIAMAWVLAAMGVAGEPSSRAEEKASAEALVVFVNKEVGADALTVEEIRQIFLRQRTTWAGGQRIACIDTRPGAPAREAFRTRVLKMTADEEKRYWQEQHIKGEATEPPTFSDTVRAVFMLKGGIGYSLRKDIKGSAVKIVREL